MRAFVIYESMFGNTLAVARAIAEGIGESMPVELVEVSSAPSAFPEDVALVVVGGPTHGHGMTTPQSRADSARRAGERLVSRGDGIREWLAALSPADPRHLAAAAFDTRIKGPGFLWGSAAKPAAKALDEQGFRLVEEPRSFLVGGPTGPMFDRLADGEVERAREWGARVAERVAAPAGAR